MTTNGPQGWNPVSIEQRFVNTSPSSADETTRSVSAIISTGQPVARFYGTEALEISQGSVDTNRVRAGMCPLLDSHQSGSIHNAIGRVTETWISNGALWARLAFNQTPQGELAWGMVRRNEIGGCSIGYRVTEWQVRDSDGDVIDQDLSYSNAASFTYIAKKFELLEVSICPVVADSGAGVRSDDRAGDPLRDVRARMQARQAMSDRMSHR
jgi:HK97 family phage prohead protease